MITSSPISQAVKPYRDLEVICISHTDITYYMYSFPWVLLAHPCGYNQEIPLFSPNFPVHLVPFTKYRIIYLSKLFIKMHKV